MTQKKVDPRRSRHGETAAHYLVAGVPRARAEQTAGEVLAAILGRHYDSVDCVCILDDEDRLMGLVPFAQLLAMPPEQRLQAASQTHSQRSRPSSCDGCDDAMGMDKVRRPI